MKFQEATSIINAQLTYSRKKATDAIEKARLSDTEKRGSLGEVSFYHAQISEAWGALSSALAVCETRVPSRVPRSDAGMEWMEAVSNGNALLSEISDIQRECASIMFKC